MSDGGKGSVQRPIANRKTFEENWDAIFGDGNELDDKLSDTGRDLLRGVVLGGGGGVPGRVHDITETSTKNKPAKRST